MNCIQSLIDRQLGIQCRFNYDYILRRLVVEEDESFYGLQSNAAGAGIGALDADPPIFACRFAEAPGYEHILALANEDGRVAIQNTRTSATAKELEGFQCHNNAVFDLAWMPGSMSFVTVSGDHTACLWDVGGGGAPRQVSVYSGHSRSVKTAAFRPGAGAVFATGARDGHVLVWDARAAPRPAAVLLRPDATLAACHASFAPRTPGSHGKRARHEPRPVSITGLAFRDERTLLSAGECDGNIKAWDMRKSYGAHRREPLPKRAIPYAGASAKRGYSSLVVDEARLRLYASCMDDVIYCFDVGSYSAAPERRYVGHENATFYIKASLSPDGRYLVSGSSDKHAYVWSVRGSEPVARLAGHRAEVTCAAWARRGDPKLVTCSDDARHMIWRVGRDPSEADLERAPRGRAEPAPRVAEPRAPALPSTPPAARRRAAPLAERDNKRARRASPPGPRRGKRCLADLMEAAGGAPKRPRLEEEPLLPAGSKRRLSESTPTAGYIAEPADWGYISPPANSSFMTPTKRHSPGAARRLRSPRAARGSPPEEGATRALEFGAPTADPPEGGAPTADLPDWVRSGEAPHLRLMSPERRRPERRDWLTQLARGRVRREPAAAPEAVNDENAAPAPARRDSASERAPRAGRKPRTLLEYFSVAARRD